jgi:hypothetical protein
VWSPDTLSNLAINLHHFNPSRSTKWWVVLKYDEHEKDAHLCYNAIPMNIFLVSWTFEWQFRITFESFLAEFSENFRNSSRVPKFLRGVASSHYRAQFLCS